MKNYSKMLINNFYTCHDIEIAENVQNCRVVFNAAHSIFKGHFPGQPVVPGVCMMEIVKELLQQKLGKSLILRSSRNVKFLGFITPDVQPAIKISWKEADGTYSVNASFSNGEAALFKLDGVYAIR